MINNLFIFGAEKLFILSPLVALWFFYKLQVGKRKEIIIFSLFTLPLAFVLAVIARKLYFDPRQFVVEGFKPLIPHTSDNGFPSDHTLLLSTIAAVVTFFDRKYAIFFWIVAFMVGVSRIYVGVHHLVDILGSIAISVLSAIIINSILRSRGKRV